MKTAETLKIANSWFCPQLGWIKVVEWIIAGTLFLLAFVSGYRGNYFFLLGFLGIVLVWRLIRVPILVKGFIIVVIVLGLGIYIQLPKRVGGCGVLPGGVSCYASYCPNGIPIAVIVGYECVGGSERHPIPLP